MKRGDLYLVTNSSAADPKKARAFVVVSRQALLGTRFSTVICAPVYTTRDGLSTQVLVGIDEGLKHDSSIHCDALMSLPKSMLTHFIGTLSERKIQELDEALKIALDLEDRGTVLE